MKLQRCVRFAIMMVGLLALLGVVPAEAQEASQAGTGTKYGDYNVQQTAEVGFRYVNMGGNMANYGTFENLGSGARLLDYTLDVVSPDHKGKLFDNISLYNFGYGGDPNDLTHLRVTKSRIYEFTGQFRRDTNFFAYNLLANPLNPSNFNPAPIPTTFAPHDLNLVHRMTDLNLTLLPQSRISLRLGYSRNVNEGPSFTTLDGGTEPQLFQQFKTTMNSYRMGADFKVLPRTTISYDEFLDYFKQDTGWFDQHFGNYQLAPQPPNTVTGGTPVDLGIVFIGNSPCKNSTVMPITTVPPTANPNCNGFINYSHVAQPRTSLPTEHLSFESSYIKNLTMSGQLSYAKANSVGNNYLESFLGNTVRTLEQQTSQAGPSDAKRVTVVADWAGTYAINDKFRVVDEFGYNNYRIPGSWNFAFGSAFAQTNPPSMLMAPAIAPQATVTATIAQFDATCPASSGYTGPGCPVHGSGSPADQSIGLDVRFLGQNVKANKIELEYDFTPRLGGRLGYRYGSRTISDFNGTDFSPAGKTELFLPGPEPGPITPGPLGAPSAQRGDCTLVSGALPAGCTAQPDGSIIFTGDNTDPSRNIVNIHENSLLMGLWARPTDSLRMSFDLELFGADLSFTRITPRQMQHYRVHATYTLKKWASLDGSVNIRESRDNTQFVNDLEHNRSFSFVATLMPRERYTFDLGYTYNNVFSSALVCYNYGFSPTLPPGGIGIPCTLPSGPGQINDSTSSTFDQFQTDGFYKDAVHYPYFDFMWKPVKRITTTLGYSGTFTRGSMPFLNPLQPSGTLSYTYQKPYASVAFDVGGGISYKAAWTYYGYNPRGIQVPTIASTGTSLAVPTTGPNGFLQDFNGNTVMFSLRYTH